MGFCDGMTAGRLVSEREYAISSNDASFRHQLFGNVFSTSHTMTSIW